MISLVNNGQQWWTMVNNVQQWLTMVKSNLNDVLQTPGPVFSNRGWESRLSCEQRCKWRREWYLKSWYVIRWYFKSCPTFCEGLQHRGHPWGNEAGRCARRSSEIPLSYIWAASQITLSYIWAFEQQSVSQISLLHLSSQSDYQHGTIWAASQIASMERCQEVVAEMPMSSQSHTNMFSRSIKYVFKVSELVGDEVLLCGGRDTEGTIRWENLTIRSATDEKT